MQNTQPRISCPRPPRARTARLRRGISFTEVLFAVILLGIGFIMLAAMFPVAIQQSKTTTEETQGSTIARDALQVLQAVADRSVMPPTDFVTTEYTTAGNVVAPTKGGVALMLQPGEQVVIAGKMVSFRDNRFLNAPVLYRDRLWTALKGNQFLANDSRYAWVAFYRRDRIYRNDTEAALPIASDQLTRIDVPYAQVVIIGVQTRNASSYGIGDLLRYPADGTSNTPAVLEGQPVLANFSFGSPSTVEFTNGAMDAVAEGCYVVVSESIIRDVNSPFYGKAAGKVYRVGNRTDIDNVWELMPGHDLRAEDSNVGINGVAAYVIGRGYTDPADPSQGFSGPAQDVGAYSSFVRVR